MSTVVFFHAHPDDEVLLTGGTIAMLAAQGHRVVIVVATDGVMFGPDSDAPPAGGRSRLDELRASATILGAARVEHLGYADSGHGPVFYDDPPGRVRFARADVRAAAERLADVLSQEQAGLLISYDEHGGYGHRDHIQVHRVGAQAAVLAGTPRLAEAVAPREPFTWIARILSVFRLIIRFDTNTVRGAGTPRQLITHRLDVRHFARQKRAALAAHRSVAWPASAGRSARLFWAVSRLPVPVFGLLLGREWFIETPVGADSAPGERPPPHPGPKKSRLL